MPKSTTAGAPPHDPMAMLARAFDPWIPIDKIRPSFVKLIREEADAHTRAVATKSVNGRLYFHKDLLK